MKKITSLGYIAFACILLFAVACSQSPSASIHNSWKLTNVEMPDADSIAIAQMNSAEVTYTFKEDSTYNYDIQGTTGAGTFIINQEGTQLTMTEEGQTETIRAVLSDTSLILSKGSEKMMFTVKK
ncbi:MAG: DUF4923 family protein [Bacteroidia bacterium]|jgi:hypothetical protein|tara:strand:+ start:10707 stop:11081 length:375 start_codon:yes stop_codon:yes gene_type:complete